MGGRWPSDQVSARRSRVLFRHIIVNCLSPVMVQGSVDFGQAIIFAAGLSFIGLGAQPPTAEWGAMATEGSKYMREAWWFTTFPGLAILVSVMGFNLVGDGLRDFLDPRLRHGRSHLALRRVD